MKELFPIVLAYVAVAVCLLIALNAAKDQWREDLERSRTNSRATPRKGQR